MGDPMELNFEDLQMQKWNIGVDGAQKTNKRNMGISLIIMFIMLMAHVFVFSADDSKKLVKVWAKYLKCT